MMSLPASAVRACERERLLRPACPRRAPRVPRYVAAAIPRPGLPWETFDLRYRWPYGSPRQNRPPRFAHVVVEGGDLRRALPFRLPSERHTKLNAALVARERSSPLLVGRPRWGGRTGTLVLAPSFDRSSTIHGDHLMYVWHAGGVGYVVSLHVWSPPAETVAALESIVESIPRGAR
jgi:hypothetical protein